MASVDHLVEWAVNNGAKIHPSLKFKELKPNYFGVVFEGKVDTSDDLKKSLVRLPLDLAITLDDAIYSFGKISKADFTDISSKTSNVNSLLKLFLSRERSAAHLKTSKYAEYLSILPKLQSMTTPYCWNAELKALIKGTNLGNSLRENISHLVEEWWEMINLLPDDLEKPESHFVSMKFYYEYKFYKDEDIYDYFVVNEDPQSWTSFPNYLWASLIIKSRAFPTYLTKEYNSRKDNIKQDETMLLPVIDIFNHQMKAKVNWSASNEDEIPCFNFGSESIQEGQEVFNNYGMKGNEELLLAYGFCTEDNVADSAALRIKIPPQLMPELKKFGVKLPQPEDYTTSVIRKTASNETGINKTDLGTPEDSLFFITQTHLPDNLIDLFSVLTKNGWENNMTLRMRLSGINSLRKALEAKSNIIPNVETHSDDYNIRNIDIYVKSQKKIYSSAIKTLKNLEKKLLHDENNKNRFITLKNVYKKDIPFQHSLLINLGISSYDQLIESQFQDQCWLLYLMRCYNRSEYVVSDQSKNENSNIYLPEWISALFKKLEKEIDITANEKLQYKPFYQQLIPELAAQIPEIYNVGNWSIDVMVLSAKLLDVISFVRGKEQDCILVEPESNLL